MTRFDFFRQKWTSLSIATLLATGMMLSVPQASFANDWMDMLKPLVKDVIVPGASMGMKKLMQREERLHPELAKFNSASSSTYTSATVTGATMGADSDFFNNSSSTSTATSSANEFTSPEEPISSSNIGSADGANIGSADGSDFWSTSHSASATDPAPPPPPPVATP